MLYSVLGLGFFVFWGGGGVCVVLWVVFVAGFCLGCFVLGFFFVVVLGEFFLVCFFVLLFAA